MARTRSKIRPRVFRGPASHFAGADTEIMEVSFPSLSEDQDPARLGRAHEYAGCLIRFRRMDDGTAWISIYAADGAIRVDAPAECTPDMRPRRKVRQ